MSLQHPRIVIPGPSPGSWSGAGSARNPGSMATVSIRFRGFAGQTAAPRNDGLRFAAAGS
jgi:hypothetical protein